MRPEIALDRPVKALYLVLFEEKRKPLDDFRAFHAVHVHKEARHHAEHFLLDECSFPAGQVGNVQLLSPREKFALDVVFVRTGFIKHGEAIYPRKDSLFDA